MASKKLWFKVGMRASADPDTDWEPNLPLDVDWSNPEIEFLAAHQDSNLGDQAENIYFVKDKTGTVVDAIVAVARRRLAERSDATA